ncbi:hypothetical protein VNI00_017109 [Paramarasmius palmivorus]|uniref:CxC2-like cysteine cluster KDZ transposase-associated domain-containing protein n=1 Tax=Paramarasmius palmivorus TaxID=297713 RepID=A0AAW0B9U5_9AGAR
MSSKRHRKQAPSLSQYSPEDLDLSDGEVPSKKTKILASVVTSSISADRRRVTTVPLKMRPPVSSSEQDTSSAPSQSLSEGIADMHVDEVYDDIQTIDGGLYSTSGDKIPAQTKLNKRKRTTDAGDNLDWMSLRDEYLRILMVGEGRGDNAKDCCRRCKKKGHLPQYRCRDCFSMELMCKGCIVDLHRERPLDVIQFWNGRFFQRVSLESLGLVVQLGHTSNTPCPAPNTSAPANFTVLHTNGFHRVRIQYCECGNAGSLAHMHQQLLRHEWYPATAKVPKTAFTFRLLEHFHTMTLVGKVTAYDYYRGLENLTDNAGSFSFKKRYAQFRRAIRQWRHLKLLKRGGRGNDGVRDISETRPGELAVICPACPRPGINLPDNWLQASSQQRLFLAVDACFRLKRKLVSNEDADPGFGTGFAYLVEDGRYREYLRDMTNETEMSTCSGLAALDHANSRNARGNYSSSGVGLGCCARHEFIQPNGVGDLQKGERYCNIDWIIACILGHHSPDLDVCLSYDICCQYCRRFIERIMGLPVDVRPKALADFLFVIPKLHVYGHTIKCQLNFSLNYALGVGRTDGEGVERNWAGQGPIATSTIEMGPGSRHDTLDDHWSFWNWQKLLGLGVLLLRRLKLAVRWAAIQEELHRAQTINQAARAPTWKKAVHDFEADKTSPNPYEFPKKGLTIQEVRVQLAREEYSSLSADQAVLDEALLDDEHLSTKGPTELLLSAFDIEEKQRQLRESRLLKKMGYTLKQVGDILDKQTRLRKITSRFYNQQDHLMPIVRSLRQSKPINPDEVEAMPLFLPSSLSPEQLAACPAADFAKIELRLREAQCSEALDELRNQLLVTSRLHTYKSAQARHQGRLRRSSKLMQLSESKCRLHASRYQNAWEAIRMLRGGDPNAVPWRKLLSTDIRCMEDAEDRAIGVPRKKLGNKTHSVGKEKAKEVMGRSLEEEVDMDEEASEDDDGQEGFGDEDEEGDDEDEDDDDDEGNNELEVEPEAADKRWRTKRDEMLKKTGEGYRGTSWIWWAADGGGFASDESLYAGLRVEWAKSYARLRRWQEETQLVTEEMRRTIKSLIWSATQWEIRASVPSFQGAHAEGASAYAYRQASMYRHLAASFATQWKKQSAKSSSQEGISSESEDVTEDALRLSLSGEESDLEQ